MLSGKSKNGENSMSSMDIHFFGGFPMEEQKECAVIGLIKKQKNDLEEDLEAAKLRFAESALDDENWQGKYERKMDCKIIEGKINILAKLERDFNNMLAPPLIQ